MRRLRLTNSATSPFITNTYILTTRELIYKPR